MAESYNRGMRATANPQAKSVVMLQGEETEVEFRNITNRVPAPPATRP